MKKAFKKATGYTLGLYGVANLAYNGFKFAAASSTGFFAPIPLMVMGVGALVLYGSSKLLQDSGPTPSQA